MFSLNLLYSPAVILGDNLRIIDVLINGTTRLIFIVISIRLTQEKATKKNGINVYSLWCRPDSLRTITNVTSTFIKIT